MSHPFAVLDVFTTCPLEGNPLAIVLEAQDLPALQMQRIAREFNLSETVFILPPNDSRHSARLRIFTPETELPFAGHPTVGTACYLAIRNASGDAVITLGEEIGVVRCGVNVRAALAFAEFDLPVLPEPLAPVPSDEAAAPALGLSPIDVGFGEHRPWRVSAGVPYFFVPVASLEAVARARPNIAAWDVAFGSGPHNNAYVYSADTVNSAHDFHARMFWPSAGGA